MFSKKLIMESTRGYLYNITKARKLIESADAIVIGAGSGLSATDGFQYGGDRFLENFYEYHEKYGLTDMYSAGFHKFNSLEEYWAYWSKHIWINRYRDRPAEVYKNLLSILKDKNYFIITTNVDHCFQRAGFDKDRLYYMQGDYGLWQCSKPCRQITYDNFYAVQKMIENINDMKIPSDLNPYCKYCKSPLTMNLRIDSKFVQDRGWYMAKDRYDKFLNENIGKNILF